jgi:hypothetical protein
LSSRIGNTASEGSPVDRDGLSRAQRAAWWLAIGAGVALRVHRYAENRSLWFDELTVALRLRQASWLELLRPADIATAIYRVDRDMAPAPVGFLWSVKALTLLFGDSEWALRCVPLAASLAALFAFALALSRWLEPRGRLVATALFALSPLQTLFAAELKPYTLDALIAVILLVAYDAAARAEAPRRAWCCAGLAAAASVFASFPAVFTIAGAGGAALLAAQRERQGRERLRAIALAGIALPALAFAGYWWTSLRALGASEFLNEFWSAYFPQSPFTPEGRAFWYRSIHGISLLWGPLPLEWIGVGLLAVGAVALARSQRRRFEMLALAFAATAMAALLHRYPVQERLLLFLDPALALLFAAGLVPLLGGLRDLDRALPWLVLAGLLANPIGMHLELVRDPNYGYRSEAVREALAQVAKERQPDDQLYVYYGASHAFGYYARRLGLDRADAVHEPWRPGSALGEVLSQLDPGRRVWAIFSQAYAPEREAIEARLGAKRPLLARTETVRAAALLYGAEGEGAAAGGASPR